MALKIPPPLLALLCAAVMYGLAQTGVLTITAAWQWPLVLVLLLLAVLLFVSAVASLLLAKTTVNPLTPQASRHLVSRGVFAISRNPIYLADALLLLAWAVYLGSVPALAGVVLFIVWINRFQIVPEENALAQLFADEYQRYCRRVRRWL